MVSLDTFRNMGGLSCFIVGVGREDNKSANGDVTRKCKPWGFLLQRVSRTLNSKNRDREKCQTYGKEIKPFFFFFVFAMAGHVNRNHAFQKQNQ